MVVMIDAYRRVEAQEQHEDHRGRSRHGVRQRHHVAPDHVDQLPEAGHPPTKRGKNMWFSINGVPPKMVGLEEKIPLDWMIYRGTPISGNLHIGNFGDMNGCFSGHVHGCEWMLMDMNGYA